MTADDRAGHSPEFATAWRDHRRRLLNLAYRMTGTMSDAEDIVQEAYARLLRSDTGAIDDVEGWLIAVSSRLCLDHLRSARVTRTAYVGPWLPEPIVTLPGSDPDPADRVTLDDTVRMALLVVLDQLSPAERVAFVLHDVFHYPFDEVSSITGRSAAACRQLASRARRRVASVRDVQRSADATAAERVVARFVRACDGGDVAGLIEVLAADASGTFDSGGTIPGAPIMPVHGAGPIARTLLASFAGTNAQFVSAWVNGEPGGAVRIGERTVAVLSFEVIGDRITHIRAVGNRAKLRRPAVPDPPARRA